MTFGGNCTLYIFGRNLEVKIGVYDKSGSEIVNSIFPASGGGPVTPAIYYHNNTPSWGETVKVEVAIDQFQAEGCHLRLEFCAPQNSHKMST